MEYTREEKETIIRTDDLMEYWDIYTAQRTMCTKIRKIKGVEILRETTTENGTVIEGRYKLPLKQLSFRNLKELSEKRRAEMASAARERFHKEE